MRLERLTSRPFTTVLELMFPGLQRFLLGLLIERDESHTAASVVSTPSLPDSCAFMHFLFFKDDAPLASLIQRN